MTLPIILLLVDLLVWATRADICYLGEVAHPSEPGKRVWAVPLWQRCSCTAILLGGVGAPFPSRKLYYLERPDVSTDRRKTAKLLGCGVEFSIIGKPAEQSSTYRTGTADKSVDGLTDTMTNGACSHTGGSSAAREMDPWWRVDLQGDHCISKISILNRGHCCNERTTHAVVRAGPSKNITINPTCGLPVTAEQAAIPGALIHIECDPPLRARYVSVDIPVLTILNFCEVMVEEFPLSICDP